MVRCRFLYLIGELRAGGSERQLYYLLKTMERERYRPGVLVWNFKEAEVYVPHFRELGVPLYFPRANSAVKKLAEVRSLVKRVGSELIHCFSFYLNVAAYWAVCGTHAVAIGSVRSDFLEDMRDNGLLLGNLNAYCPRDQIYNSFSAAQKAQRSRGFSALRRLSVIRNGVDLNSFRNIPSTWTQKVRILGVGSLFPGKRWDRLLRAAAVLKQRNFDCTVQIVGDGPMRDSLKDQARALGIADRVEFLGHSENVPALLANAAFLVHPSDSEGCPNVVMEAMACGRAVVATDIGDVPYLVEHGETGYVVPRDDETKLLEEMIKLMTNPELCWRMGERARHKAEREFGLERLVDETFACYRAAGWNG
jgi:L-malate glycosyltransferase